jgi:hypothetical protein
MTGGGASTDGEGTWPRQRSVGPSDRPGRGSGEHNRGQTLQDFTIGIGLFIITIAAVFSSFFGFLGPFSLGVTGDDVAESDRVANTVVGNLSIGQPPNALKEGLLANTLSKPDSTLRKRWGLAESTRFNVTVRTLNGTRIASVGGFRLATDTDYRGGSAATTARIVTLDADGSACEPACRLVVRTW